MSNKLLKQLKGMLGVLLKKLMEVLKVHVLPYVKIVKDFIKTKGFTALVSLGFGSILLLMGYPFVGGIGFGVFFSKNTEIIKELIEDYM